MFEFSASNRLKNGQTENTKFSQAFTAREGQSAAFIGYPIFFGLNTGTEGVAFRCRTINVSNNNDEQILAFLKSETFKAGLKLAETAQPAITPLTEMVVGVTKMLANRNKNVVVQDFFMGLDFSTGAGGARLREGTYIAVQIPETFEIAFKWEEWAYDQENGRIVNKVSPNQLIPYNFISFSVDLEN